MNYSSVVTLLLISAFGVCCNGARILAIFSTPSISHQVVFRPLMLELSRRGHDVTVMTTDPIFEKDKAPTNYTEIDVHDMSYSHWKEFITTADFRDNVEFIRLVVTNIYILTKKQLEVEQMKVVTSKHAKKYDLLFFETHFIEFSDIAREQNIPAIQFITVPGLFFIYAEFGAPTHPLVYPEFYQKRIINLTIWEKFHQIIEDISMRFMIKNKMYYTEEDGTRSPILASNSDVDMLFVNSHPIWDNNRAVPPNVVYLGGMHLKPEKEIETDLKAYLDSSKNGVIYMSFGTNVDPTLLPKEKIDVFCNVFSKLPFDVLWKWNGDQLHCQPDNVKISKWLPQSDLLRHPNIKVFITQAGLQSTDESITAGVPLIAFPMLGDQWYNAEKYVQHKIGMKMDFTTVTEGSLENAIKTVIEDKSYRENILKLKAIMNDQPQSSLDRAVWWTEYVLRHGGAKHLRSPMASISWTEYLMLDVVAMALGILAVAFGLLIYICKKFSKNYFRLIKLKDS